MRHLVRPERGVPCRLPCSHSAAGRQFPACLCLRQLLLDLLHELDHGAAAVDGAAGELAVGPQQHRTRHARTAERGAGGELQVVQRVP